MHHYEQQIIEDEAKRAEVNQIETTCGLRVCGHLCGHENLDTRKCEAGFGNCPHQVPVKELSPCTGK